MSYLAGPLQFENSGAGDYRDIDVSAPYRVMLLSPTPALPEGEGWLFQMKLDGFRCLAQVIDGRVRLWSRGGNDWAARLPEMESLAGLGDLVLDGELVVTSADGRADFELLGARMQDRRRHPSPAVTLYAFDVLRVGDEELVDQPLETRRAVLEGLDLARRTGGSVRATVWSSDGRAMHEATAAIGGEGTVAKQRGSLYRPGLRSKRWLKSKHTVEKVLEVAGWRPSTSSRPGGLMLAEGDEVIGTATIALPDEQRRGLVELIGRYGRRHPSGALTIPPGAIKATVRYTCRTPTHGHLREAVVVALHPTSVARR